MLQKKKGGRERGYVFLGSGHKRKRGVAKVMPLLKSTSPGLREEGFSGVGNVCRKPQNPRPTKEKGVLLTQKKVNKLERG